MEDHYAELKAELAANETEHKSFKRRLDEHDGALKLQNDILIQMERQNGNIERMTGSMSRMEKSIESMDKRLDAIEQEPADKWRKISFEVLKYLVIALLGVAVGYVINGIGK